ncbi:MAG: PAS domain S-box protein [Bacteroidota bacterium]
MNSWLFKIWEDYLLIGTSNSYLDEFNDKIKVMNQTYALGGIGLLASFIFHVSFGYLGVAAAVPGVTFFIFLIFPLLSYRKLHRLAWHLSLITILTAVTISGFGRPVLYANYLIYNAVLFLTMFLFNNEIRIQIAYLFFVCINLTTFYYLSTLPTPYPVTDYPFLFSVLMILIAFGVNYAIIHITREYKYEQDRKLAYVVSLKNAALNAHKDATMIVSIDRKITGYNEAYLQMWGYDKTEVENETSYYLLQKGLLKLKNTEEVREIFRIFKKNLQLKTNKLLYFKDGRIVDCHTQPQILNGKVVGRVYNYQDITEQHHAQLKLKESEARHRSLFEKSPLGIDVIDHTEEILVHNFNPKFCELLEYSAEELKKVDINSISVQEFQQTHHEERKKLLMGLIDKFSIKKQYLTKSGKIFWAKVNTSLNRDQSGRILNEIVMVEDIHEQQLQEERIKNLVVELKSLNEKLEQKVKMRTVDLQQSNEELRRSNQDLEQFAYIASHDLQEPLRMVGNFVQLLERQYRHKIDGEGAEYIHFIVDGVSRMSNLIHNLLKYSRVGRKEAELRLVNLGRIVEAKLFGLQRLIKEKGADIHLGTFPDKVFCEPDQLGMVFFNLITNALKFNNGQPTIIIQAENRPDDLLFSVKDNGIGIDKQFSHKVFEIFKRLHRREEYEGTGIGLALCKKIIARHGGEIWFESEPNRGTTFFFTISKNLINEKYVPLDSNLVGGGQ